MTHLCRPRWLPSGLASMASRQASSSHRVRTKGIMRCRLGVSSRTELAAHDRGVARHAGVGDERPHAASWAPSRARSSARPGSRRRCRPPLVDAILDYAGEHPTHGPRTIAAALTLPRFGSWQVSASGVYQVLVRARLNRTRMRLAAAELLAATAGGPVTEGALRDLRAVQRQIAHKGSDVVGRSVFFDTTYVGNLKGVGKIWQYSAVDGACSFGFAHARVGPKTATDAADFLEQHVLPMYRELGVALVEVVTDGGPRVRRGRLPPRL